jgi:hypothetical protein
MKSIKVKKLFEYLEVNSLSQTIELDFVIKKIEELKFSIENKKLNTKNSRIKRDIRSLNLEKKVFVEDSLSKKQIKNKLGLREADIKQIATTKKLGEFRYLKSDVMSYIKQRRLNIHRK